MAANCVARKRQLEFEGQTFYVTSSVITILSRYVNKDSNSSGRPCKSNLHSTSEDRSNRVTYILEESQHFIVRSVVRDEETCM